MFSLQDLRHDPIFLRFIFSIFVILVMFIVKRFLSPWIIRLLSHIKVHHVSLDAKLLEALKKPIDRFVYLTGFAIALIVSPFVYSTTPMEQTLNLGELHITLSFLSITTITKFYCSFFFANLTFLLYEFEQIYEHFFMKVNKELALVENTVIIRYLSRIINFATLTLGSTTSLIILVPNLSHVITGVGVGGAAVALIAKDSIAGVISGIFLLLDKPFVIGDLVNINNVEGYVEDISFRSTRLRTFSQSVVVVPNNTINNAVIINYSRMDKRRVEFDLGVSYNTTNNQMKQCIKCIHELLASFDEIEKDTEVINFVAFGDYSLNIKIIYYTYSIQLAAYLDIQERVNLKILELCNQLKINIAFPTQVILSPTSPE